MPKSEMQSIYDSIFSALENAGLSPREGDGDGIVVEIGGRDVEVLVQAR